MFGLWLCARPCVRLGEPLGRADLFYLFYLFYLFILFNNVYNDSLLRPDQILLFYGL